MLIILNMFIIIDKVTVMVIVIVLALLHWCGEMSIVWHITGDYKNKKMCDCQHLYKDAHVQTHLQIS